MCGPFRLARRLRRPTGQRGEAFFRSEEPEIQARSASKWVGVMPSRTHLLALRARITMPRSLTALPTGASQQLPSPGSSCAALRAYPPAANRLKNCTTPFGGLFPFPKAVHEPAQPLLWIPARPMDRQPAMKPVKCRKRQTSQVVLAAQGSIAWQFDRCSPWNCDHARPASIRSLVDARYASVPRFCQSRPETEMRLRPTTPTRKRPLWRPRNERLPPPPPRETRKDHAAGDGCATAGSTVRICPLRPFSVG